MYSNQRPMEGYLLPAETTSPGDKCMTRAPTSTIELKRPHDHHIPRTLGKAWVMAAMTVCIQFQSN